MFCFRLHRGGFKESMATKTSYDELWQVIEYCSIICDCNISDIIVQYYSYDSRVESVCYLVSRVTNKKYYPVGFCWVERS